MNRITGIIAPALAALAFSGCNPEPASEPEVAETPSPAPAPWDYATPQGDDEELTPAQTTPGPIPLPYRAVWAIEQIDCTSDPGLTRISIAPGTIRFYEGRSVVQSATVRPDGSLELEVEHMSEGTTESQRHVLRLSGDAESLSYSRGDSTFAYRRCAT